MRCALTKPTADGPSRLVRSIATAANRRSQCEPTGRLEARGEKHVEHLGAVKFRREPRALRYHAASSVLGSARQCVLAPQSHPPTLISGGQLGPRDVLGSCSTSPILPSTSTDQPRGWNISPRHSEPSNPILNSSLTPRPEEPAPDAEVEDREWEIRVARAMLHLRETLPLLFEDKRDRDMFPNDIYSPNIVLKLPQPFPLKISGLTGYKMAFGIARSGMHALHTDLSADMQRLTFSPPPPPTSPAAAIRSSLGMERAPTHRRKQVRVSLVISGTPRLPPHTLAEWHTSSLYTFSPYSGLIACHEVETIRPLPGEGVAEWVMQRLLGWGGRHDAEGAVLPRGGA